MNGCIMLFLAAVLQTHFSFKMVMVLTREEKMHIMLEAINCVQWWRYLIPVTYSRTHTRFVHHKSFSSIA